AVLEREDWQRAETAAIAGDQRSLPYDHWRPPGGVRVRERGVCDRGVAAGLRLYEPAGLPGPGRAGSGGTAGGEAGHRRAGAEASYRSVLPVAGPDSREARPLRVPGADSEDRLPGVYTRSRPATPLHQSRPGRWRQPDPGAGAARAHDARDDAEVHAPRYGQQARGTGEDGLPWP